MCIRDSDITQNLDYREVISEILTEVLTGMRRGIYPSKITKSDPKLGRKVKDDMFNYLVKCYENVITEERNNKKKSPIAPFADAFLASRQVTIMYACLVCCGTFETDIQVTGVFTDTPLFEPLLKQTLPSGFLLDMMNYAIQEFSGAQEIFVPLLRCLAAEVRSSSIVELGNYQKALSALTELCEITISGTEKNRPICQFMTEMTEWLPAEISTGSGKIRIRQCLLYIR